VNGRVVQELGERADPACDRISVDGERVRLPKRRRTIVLHKPRGVVSTLSDPQGRSTVRDLLTGVRERVYPVGRLDLQTTGLLLLTNDGALAEGIMHPRRGVARVYEAKVRGCPSGAALARLRRGVRLDDGAIVAVRARLLRTLPTKSWLEIILREGHWHEVRRVCEAVGHPVEKLCRVRLGPLRLEGLPIGAWRDCGPAEIRALRRAAGLTSDAVSDEDEAGERPRRGTPRRKRPARSAGSPRGARGGKSPPGDTRARRQPRQRQP